jgi:hypothetical protein
VLGRQQRFRHVLTTGHAADARRRRRRGWRRLVACAALAGSVAGCAGHGDQATSEPASTIARPVTPAALPAGHRPRHSRAPGPRRSYGVLSPGDRESFTRLATSLGGSHGIAVSALGRGQRVESLGSLRTGVAWSTSKVPLAMAAIAGGLAQPDAPDIVAAITESDNTAARRLWAALGGGEAAADAADLQLRQAGDRRTQVEYRALRGTSYTAFGQTRWSLADQARFAAGLTCLRVGVDMLTLMGRVGAWQRWGLGVAGAETRLKGGWGPGAEPGIASGYLDRQMGVITIAGKPLAVALASRPSDGSHQTGTRNLTSLAHWLIERVDVRAVPEQPRC